MNIYLFIFCFQKSRTYVDSQPKKRKRKRKERIKSMFSVTKIFTTFIMTRHVTSCEQ